MIVDHIVSINFYHYGSSQNFICYINKCFNAQQGWTNDYCVRLHTCSSCDHVFFSLRAGRSHIERQPDTSRVARRWPPGLTLMLHTTPYKIIIMTSSHFTIVIIYTVEPLYSGHPWEQHFGRYIGLLRGVPLYTKFTRVCGFWLYILHYYRSISINFKIIM